MEHNALVYKNGQAAQLKKLAGRVLIALVVGAVLLVCAIASSLMLTKAKDSELAVTMALNQYRLASKTLTENAQYYSVRGLEQLLQTISSIRSNDLNSELNIHIYMFV